MNTKLTLRMDEELIEGAKRYAEREGRSVSELVAAYFARLDAPVSPTARTAKSGRRSSFYGLVPAGKKLDELAYRKHLTQKHQ
jgi:hypothetical protein